MAMKGDFPTSFLQGVSTDFPIEAEAGPVGVSIRGVKEFVENMKIVKEYLSDTAVRVIALIAVDLLVTAQPRVPYDEGKLRQSGTALVLFGGKYSKIVGRGRLSPANAPDATIDVDLSGLKGRTEGIKYLSANVSYHRTGDMGVDVAVFTHEDLLPYEARPAHPAARQVGTGPKYLESAWNEKKEQYLAWLRDAYSYNELEKDLRRMMVGSARAKNKFEVEITKLRRI